MKKWQPSIELERLIQMVCEGKQVTIGVTVTVGENGRNITVVIDPERDTSEQACPLTFRQED